MRDITITVVELLLELTDVDVLNESEEGAEVLLDALVSYANSLTLIARRLYTRQELRDVITAC